MKSENLNFLEPSGPLQACNGTDIPLPYIPNQWHITKILITNIESHVVFLIVQHKGSVAVALDVSGVHF